MAVPSLSSTYAETDIVSDASTRSPCEKKRLLSKEAFLAEAGYTHVEGSLHPPPLDQPPFTIKTIRDAVPAHCFERSLVRSFYYLIKNLIICAALFFAAGYIDTINSILARWVLWPTYWFFQGSYLTGLWVIAHECGHQAFSDMEVVNNTVGLILHSALLVPYHSWRISHRQHHSNTGSCENDAVFVPPSKSSLGEGVLAESMEHSPLYNAYNLVLMLAVGWMPGYLFFNCTGPEKHNGQSRSHFNPYAVMYKDRERWMIFLSDILVIFCVAALTYMAFILSFVTMVKYYIIPYMIVNVYLVSITYLQHTDTYLPHYREGEWNWLRGALATVDRSFGTYLDDVLHHIVDTHVAHHLFSKIPFYHAQEVTNAIKPILQKYYLSDPTPAWQALWRSYKYSLLHPKSRKIVVIVVTYAVLTVWYYYRHWSKKRSRSKPKESRSRKPIVKQTQSLSEGLEMKNVEYNAMNEERPVHVEQRKSRFRVFKKKEEVDCGEGSKNVHSALHRFSKRDVTVETLEGIPADHSISSASSSQQMEADAVRRRTYKGRKKPEDWGK